MRLNLPDQLAVIRILLAPIVMLLVTQSEFGLAAILFVIAAFTDFLDGYLARRFNLASVIGAFLDSTADKLLVTGSFLALISVGRASIWAAVIIITREFAVMALRSLAALDGVQVPPSIWGKVKANAQFLALGMAMLRPAEPLGPWFLDEYVMLVAVVLTVISGWDYIASFFRNRQLA